MEGTLPDPLRRLRDCLMRDVRRAAAEEGVLDAALLALLAFETGALLVCQDPRILMAKDGVDLVWRNIAAGNPGGPDTRPVRSRAEDLSAGPLPGGTPPQASPAPAPVAASSIPSTSPDAPPHCGASAPATLAPSMPPRGRPPHRLRLEHGGERDNQSQHLRVCAREWPRHNLQLPDLQGPHRPERTRSCHSLPPSRSSRAR